MPAKWKTGIFLTNIVEKNKTKNAKRKSFINEGGNMGKLKVLVAESQTVVKQFRNCSSGGYWQRKRCFWNF